MKNEMIRFIDSSYNELFLIPNGANIVITAPTGEKFVRRCEYLGETHFTINNSCYHCCQFAEIMERNGNTYEPQDQLENIDISIVLNDEKEMLYRSEEDNASIGTMYGNFGRSGTRFFHNWIDYNKELVTQEFQNELQYVIYALRKEMLKDYELMSVYCHNNPNAKIEGEDYRYGFKLETEKHRYYIRLTTLKDDYFYVFCYLAENMI